MYTRFYNSIISPKNLIQFRNDSLFRVFFYIIFFALLLSTRVTIDIINYDGLSIVSKEAIKSEIISVNTSCEITNSVLECDEIESTLVYETLTMAFYMDSFDNWNPSIYGNYGYNVVLHDDVIDVVVSGRSLMSVKISDLSPEIQNFDFETYETDETTFYNVLFNTVDDVTLGSKNIWGPMIVIFDFLMNLIMFILFILLSTWMLRIRFRQIRFKHLFVMSTYSSTALFVIMIINSLYNFSFFLVIILLLVAIRQNSQLSLELQNRLTKKP